jgi:hypothetical protein
MCNWCEALKEIQEIMKKYGLRSRDLSNELDSWYCEDTDDDESSNDDEKEEKEEKKEE